MELPGDVTALPTLPIAGTPASAPSVPPLVPGSAAADTLGSVQKATPASLPLTGALPAAWLAAAAPVALAPAPALIATVQDRRVRLGPPGAPEEAQPSLYRLCRQWVQNDPDLGEPLGAELPASKLPPLPPVSEEAATVLLQPAPVETPLPAPAAAPAASEGAGAADAAAAPSSAAEPPAVDALLSGHKQHWAAVRQHKRTQVAAAQQRYAQRLQAFLAQSGGAASGAAALPVPMQQG